MSISLARRLTIFLLSVVMFLAGCSKDESTDDPRTWYSPSGHLVFLQSSSLMAAPFDLDRLTIGTPVELADDLVTSRGGYGEYSFSAGGTLLYLSGVSDFERFLVRVDRAGKPRAAQRTGTELRLWPRHFARW